MNKENMTKRGETGITLIALVITIIVLLILAGVSIAMLTGDNGILTQANESKIATEEGKVKEMVSVAIGGLQAEYLGDRSKITPQKIAEQVNKDNNRTDVTASSTTFPTEIIFPEEGLNVPVDMDLNVGETREENGEETGDLPIYSEDIDESQIAPADLFDFEPIEGTALNTKVATTGTISGLPQKEAKITGIKPEYCNKDGYNPNTDEGDLEDTNYEIKYDGITDTLIIPYQVEIDGEMYKITEVDISVADWGDFHPISLPSIENIIYPNTVKKIGNGDYGFYGTEKSHRLRNVVLSKSLIEIPSYFFYSSNISAIDIPSSVTSMGYQAFGDCKLLTKVNILEGATTIGVEAFYGCSELKEINIPESVTSIGDEAFSSCSALTTINIPDGVTNIGTMAFYGCSVLTTINIPESVTSIGDGAFSSCSALTTINIPNNVTTIGASAFSGCSALKEINIPAGVKSISRNVFSGCSALTTINIPDGVTSIDINAFEDCTSLTTINIPESVTSMGNDYYGGIFAGCESLTEIKIPSKVNSIGRETFSGCEALTKVEIPSSVTNIESHAFSGCSALTTINIPESVTNINEYAFYRCDAIRKINVAKPKGSLSGSPWGAIYATVNWNYQGK